MRRLSHASTARSRPRVDAERRPRAALTATRDTAAARCRAASQIRAQLPARAADTSPGGLMPRIRTADVRTQVLVSAQSDELQPAAGTNNLISRTEQRALSEDASAAVDL